MSHFYNKVGFVTLYLKAWLVHPSLILLMLPLRSHPGLVSCLLSLATQQALSLSFFNKPIIPNVRPQLITLPHNIYTVTHIYMNLMDLNNIIHFGSSL